MAITFQYGPISSAIGLAQKAGAGQRQQDLFNQGLQFNKLINDEQARIDQKNAGDVQRALGVDEFNARTAAGDREFQSQQDQQAINNQWRDQEAKSKDQELAASRAIAQQNANTQAKNADTNASYHTATTDLRDKKFTTQQDALNQLDPAQAEMIRANGHLPAGQHDQTSALAQQYRLLLDEARRVQKDQDAASYDENDMKKLGAAQSTRVPGAIAGMEDRYIAAKARLQGLTGRIQSTEQQLNNPASSITGNTVAPNVGQQVLQQQQQSSAPAQQPRIIATATNPQTGQRIGFDANTGRWVKI